MSNKNAKDNDEESDMGVLNADSCMPIAIVGIGFRGPGDAQNVEKLEEMIRTGREAWSAIPAKRWNNTAFYHPDHSRHGTVGYPSPKQGLK
jgi:acyl transferase domain-containing protein